MNNPVAVIIGRWQILQKGHVALLRAALAAAPRVIVVIGSAWRARDPHNPFTWAERQQQFEAVLSPEERPRVAFLPVRDYFRQFPGLDAGPRYNNAGFWDLPIPVTRDLEAHPDDIVIYDAAGYEPLKQFLRQEGVRHVLLTGYATDMCFCKTTAGYENLARDFNVFLVGDATLATFPSNLSPRFATNAAISYAALNHLITQVSWVKYGRTGFQPVQEAVP